MRASHRLSAGLLAMSLVVAGCGGSSTNRESASASAQPAFPAGGSQRLAQLVSARGQANPQLAPSVSVLEPGMNRFGFGLFEASGRQLSASVAVYTATTRGGDVRGPFPARLESLSVQPRFRSKTSAQDPDAARSVYVAQVPFARRGERVALAVARVDGRLIASSPAPVTVGVPAPLAVGARAPRIHTPTLAGVGGDVAKIDTRLPPDDMHAVDFAAVVGRKPVVLTFATPQLCQSRVCGPVVDEAAQLQSQLGDRAAFIHMEIYRNNKVQDGFRPQVAAFRLRSEPWVFVIDRRGRVAARVEGAASLAELRAAIDRGLS